MTEVDEIYAVLVSRPDIKEIFDKLLSLPDEQRSDALSKMIKLVDRYLSKESFVEWLRVRGDLDVVLNMYEQYIEEISTTDDVEKIDKLQQGINAYYRTYRKAGGKENHYDAMESLYLRQREGS